MRGACGRLEDGRGTPQRSAICSLVRSHPHYGPELVGGAALKSSPCHAVRDSLLERAARQNFRVSGLRAAKPSRGMFSLSPERSLNPVLARRGWRPGLDAVVRSRADHHGVHSNGCAGPSARLRCRMLLGWLWHASARIPSAPSTRKALRPSLGRCSFDLRRHFAGSPLKPSPWRWGSGTLLG